MSPLLYVIAVPFCFGLICLLIPSKNRYGREITAFIGAGIGFFLSIWMFANRPFAWGRSGLVLLKVDSLSGIMILAAGFFTLLIVIYSFKYMRKNSSPGRYYAALLWTYAATTGALLANHLVLLLVFWGFLGLTLYLLVLTGGPQAAPAAQKSLAIIGGTDALMLLGIILIYQVSATFEMDKTSLTFNSITVYAAFFLLLAGVFAKAGCMPFHTWIPDVAANAPVPVTAFLPASLDKLLGIYLLARMSLNMFEMVVSVNLVLMIIGAFTILAGVGMALVQHDMRKLLAYHAVSQVGYMVLGLGTGTVLGLLGGLFHLLNNTLYKTCLFLTAGSVKAQTGTTDLDKLGGLGRLMPWTFVSFLIAALAISGIPPLNGFVSKWMIYQGLLKLKDSGDNLWIIWLFAAMLGSGLTLASFMKLAHSVFLGQSAPSLKKLKIRENSFSIVFPLVVMAFLCIVFGVFALSGPFKLFLLPLVDSVSFPGFWAAGPVTLMILAGLVIGLIIYIIGNIKNVREADPFIGGEKLSAESRVTGTGFYNTIQEMPGIKYFYKQAAAKMYDVYEQGNKLAYGLGGFLRKAHTGFLNLYLVWILIGLVVLLILLMGR